MLAHQIGVTMRSLCLLPVIPLLFFLLRLKSQVRFHFGKYLHFSFTLYEGCSFIVFRYWSMVLRLRVLQTCMDCYLSVRSGLALAGYCFIFNSIRNKGIYIGFQVWLQHTCRLLNRNWYLPIGYWSSLWCNPIDECMATASWECLWISSTFLRTLFGQVLIWLCTEWLTRFWLFFLDMMRITLRLPMESICEEFHLFLLQVITIRF